MLVLSAESRERTRPLSHPEVQGTLTRYFPILSSCLSCPLPVLHHSSFGSVTVTVPTTVPVAVIEHQMDKYIKPR
jgi:hypothetical protein